jgi:hypothetical protein
MVAHGAQHAPVGEPINLHDDKATALWVHRTKWDPHSPQKRWAPRKRPVEETPDRAKPLSETIEHLANYSKEPGGLLILHRRFSALLAYCV